MLLFRKRLRRQLSTQSKKRKQDGSNKRSIRVAKLQKSPSRSEVSMFDLHEQEHDEIGTEFTLWDREESADM